LGATALPNHLPRTIQRFQELPFLRVRFLWVSAIMTFGNPAAIAGVELVRWFTFLG
jgi:hypothetical protein